MNRMYLWTPLTWLKISILWGPLTYKRQLILIVIFICPIITSDVFVYYISYINFNEITIFVPK